MNFPIEFRKKIKNPEEFFFFKLITTIRLYIYIYILWVKEKNGKIKKFIFLLGVYNS